MYFHKEEEEEEEVADISLVDGLILEKLELQERLHASACLTILIVKKASNFI